MMQRMKHRIRFLTPAFLGNAEQSGQWRTPPLKEAFDALPESRRGRD